MLLTCIVMSMLCDIYYTFQRAIQYLTHKISLFLLSCFVWKPMLHQKQVNPTKPTHNYKIYEKTDIKTSKGKTEKKTTTKKTNKLCTKTGTKFHKVTDRQTGKALETFKYQIYLHCSISSTSYEIFSVFIETTTTIHVIVLIRF